MRVKENQKSRTRVRSPKALGTSLSEIEPRPSDGRPARVFACLVFGATDLVVLAACFWGANLIFPQPTTNGLSPFFETFFPSIPFYLIAFIIGGLYPGFCMAPAEELRRYTTAALLVAAVEVAIKTRLCTAFDGDEVVYIATWLMSVPLLWAGRVATRALASRSSLWGVSAVVFGSGKEAQNLVDRLLRCRWIGYQSRLIITDEPRNGADYRSIPIIYGFVEGLKAAAPWRFSTALVAMPGHDPLKHREVVLRYAKAFSTFITFSDLIRTTGIWAKVRDFEGVLGLSTKQKLLVPFNNAIKHALDILSVCLIRMAAIPFSLVVALLIKLDSPGPVSTDIKGLEQRVRRSLC